jgi:hypothetical protein
LKHPIALTDLSLSEGGIELSIRSVTHDRICSLGHLMVLLFLLSTLYFLPNTLMHGKPRGFQLVAGLWIKGNNEWMDGNDLYHVHVKERMWLCHICHSLGPLSNGWA